MKIAIYNLIFWCLLIVGVYVMLPILFPVPKPEKEIMASFTLDYKLALNHRLEKMENDIKLLKLDIKLKKMRYAHEKKIKSVYDIHTDR